jgi:hypothetical protein
MSASNDGGIEGTQFVLKDCALVAIATGQKAQNLRELRERLGTISPASLYYHLWGRMLRPQFDEPEYNNDFASWAYHALNEISLAERLSAVNPADYSSLDELRYELIELIESRLDESELVPWAKADQQFYFIASNMIIFDTGVSIASPPELGGLLASASAGSIFYHFIDAKRRTAEHVDDFSSWITGFGEEYAPLQEGIQAVDPYFSSLQELKEVLQGVFNAWQQSK